MYTHIVERSHPGFRTLHPIETGCGRFSAEEVRSLMPQDLRKLGCPEHIFLTQLELAAAEKQKEGRTYIPLRTPEELRNRAAELGRKIAADDQADKGTE